MTSRDITSSTNNHLFKNKKVIIHIGMGRCGSSSIQYALKCHSTELLRQGIFYPETNPSEIAQHTLARIDDKGLKESEEEWNNILSRFEASGCHTLVISSEYFIAISPQLFDSIRRQLTEYSVNIIFIARHQRDLLPSIYAQWIKAGIAFRSFKHFYMITKQEWHYTKIITRWAESYGVKNISCAILRPGLDSVQIFAKCCDETMIKILQNTKFRMNASINPKLLPLLVLFDFFNSRNHIGSVFPGWSNIEPTCPGRNNRLRQWLVCFLEKLTEESPAQKLRGLNPRLIQEIDSEYFKTNQAFHDKYLAQESRDWFTHIN